MQRRGDGDQGLEVGVLGPLALRVDGRDVPVPGTRRQAVLGLLALAAPHPVAADRLVDAVWPDEPPASGRAALQSHVSRLRRHLGRYAPRLERVEAGYRLALEAGELDATRVTDVVARARGVGVDDPGTACGLLAGALSAWRGPPLEQLRDVEPLAAWARALTEERLVACDLLAECALRSGSPAAAVRAATAGLATDPHHEPGVLHLVRALAIQGRATEAMRVARDFRRRLVDETGLDASPALAALERAVAAGDLLHPPAAPAPTAPPRHRAPPGSLLGRDAELAGVVRLLSAARLVTLVGPGGVGKTRLALEVARRQATTTEVTLLPLAPVTDADAVPDVLARALGLSVGSGRALDSCVSWLQGRDHLLVVDNCEHLLEHVRDLLTALLSGCPGLTVLTTSRERLALPDEQLCRLAPLAMPAATDTGGLESVPSVALFLDRAGRARPGYSADRGQLAAVARIVQALDGMPLAIELAASRLSAMTADDLEARLDRALDLLGRSGSGPGGGEGRHRTLRAAVQWSYDLLPDDEQRLFRNLAAFPGGVDLDTAEQVGRELALSADPATALSHLVDCSMVVADLDEPPRYRMLDTLRRFGLDRLAAAGELEQATSRLVRWAVDLAVQLDAGYETEDEPRADRRLRAELANLRSAWRAARQSGDLDAATALTVHLYSQASWRDLTELNRWSLELAADPALVGDPREAQVLAVAAEAAWFSAGDLAAAEQLARRAGEVAAPDDELGRALSRWALADLLLFRGRYEQAAALAIEARQGTRWAAEGYAQAALAAAYGGDVVRARRRLGQAEQRAAGPTLRAYLRYVAAEIDAVAGRRDRAEAAYREAIERAGAVGATFIEGIAAVGLASVLATGGDVGEALRGFRELLLRWERTGSWTQQWTTLRNLADLLDRLGDSVTAARLRASADAAPEASAVPGTGGGERPAAGAALGRTEVLGVARDAIARALAEPTPSARAGGTDRTSSTRAPG